jgi:UDPglucose 6-dehydrogenase
MESKQPSPKNPPPRKNPNHNLLQYLAKSRKNFGMLSWRYRSITGKSTRRQNLALVAMARANQLEPRILEAVHEVNLRQKTVLGQRIVDHFAGNLRGRTIAVWGLAFKPRTDDIRDAPSLVLIDRLLAQGAKVQVQDPEAMENVRRLYGDKLTYCSEPLAALEGADALAIVTEWGEFRTPDFKAMARKMKDRVIFDGRNLYDPAAMRAAGFTYYCIGKAPVLPRKP